MESSGRGGKHHCRPEERSIRPEHRQRRSSGAPEVLRPPDTTAVLAADALLLLPARSGAAREFDLEMKKTQNWRCTGARRHQGDWPAQASRHGAAARGVAAAVGGKFWRKGRDKATYAFWASGRPCRRGAGACGGGILRVRCDPSANSGGALTRAPPHLPSCVGKRGAALIFNTFSLFRGGIMRSRRTTSLRLTHTCMYI